MTCSPDQTQFARSVWIQSARCELRWERIHRYQEIRCQPLALQTSVKKLYKGEVKAVRLSSETVPQPCRGEPCPRKRWSLSGLTKTALPSGNFLSSPCLRKAGVPRKDFLIVKFLESGTASRSTGQACVKAQAEPDQSELGDELRYGRN